MKVQNIQSNNTFGARYRLPVRLSQETIDFERHVAPLFESVTGEKIRGLVSFENLFVFTGKEDIALLNNIQSRTLGLAILRFSNSYLAHNFSQLHHRKLETRIAKKNIEIEPLNDMKELIKKLFV